MKQHITEEQLNELSEKGMERLLNWLNRHYPFDINNSKEIAIAEQGLSIGQMIEFLEENDDSIYVDSDGQKYNDKIAYVSGIRGATLCDDLWEAVKDVLVE